MGQVSSLIIFVDTEPPIFEERKKKNKHTFYALIFLSSQRFSQHVKQQAQFFLGYRDILSNYYFPEFVFMTSYVLV